MIASTTFLSERLGIKEMAWTLKQGVGNSGISEELGKKLVDYKVFIEQNAAELNEFLPKAEGGFARFWAAVCSAFSDSSHSESEGPKEPKHSWH